MLKGVVGTLGVRFLLIGATLLSSIVTARLLGPDGRGVFFYWSSVAALAMQFCTLGLPSSNTYYLSADRGLLGPMAANALWLSLAASAIFSIVVVLLDMFSPGSNHVALGLGAALILGSGLYYLILSNLLVARQRFLEFNLFELLHRYGNAAVVAGAIILVPTPSSALYASGVATLVVCAALFVFIRRLATIPFRPSVDLLRRAFRFAAKAYVITLLGFLALRLNVFVLNMHADAADLGYFSIAVQILETVNVIPATVALILFPALLRSSFPFALMLRQLAITTIVLGLVILVLLLIGEPLIVLVYGEEFAPASDLLLWGAAGALSLGLLSIVSQYLAAIGMPAMLVVVWLVGVAFEFALALILIPNWGGEGAMLAFTAAHIAIFAMAATLAWRLRSHGPNQIVGR